VVALSGMVVLLLALWGLVLPLAETHAFEPVTIQLRWSHQFQFAGYYAAVEKGFFKAEGLDVFLEPSLSGQDPVAPVLEGRAQYGVGDAGILKLRADGSPLVVLAQIFQHSPNILVTRRDSGIFSPYELQGKTIMMPTDPISGIAVKAMIMESLGSLDSVTILPHSFDDELLGFPADAVAGCLSSVPFLYKQKGLPFNIIDPRSYGIDLYGDNLYTTEQEIREHPERVEKVRRATLRGWTYALQHKEEIIDLIRGKYNPGLDREKLGFESKVVEQMILPDLVPMGELHPGRYRRIAEIFYRLDMSPSPEVPEGLFYRPVSAFDDLLTAEERAWLKAHPDIQFGFSEDFPPALIVREDGRLTGILKEMIDLLNQRLGTDFSIVVDDLPTVRNMIKDRELAGPLAMSPEAATRYQLLQTNTVLTTFPVIYARQGAAFAIHGLEDLVGRKCAIVGGTPSSEVLVKPYEDRITLTRTRTAIEAMKLLYEGKVDFFLGLAQHSYLVHTNQFVGVEPILALMDHKYDSVIGVRNDWPELVGILNKGLSAIAESERIEILNRYTGHIPNIQTRIVEMSDAEKAWIERQPTVNVNLCDYPPFIIVEQGREPTGVAIDCLNLISERTGIQFNYLGPASDGGALGRVDGGQEPDWTPAAMCGYEHGANRQLSTEYARSPVVIFTPQKGPFVGGLEDLDHKKVAVMTGTFSHVEKIWKDHPQIELISYDTPADALQAVADGKAAAYLGNLNVGSYLILKKGLSNIKVAAPTGLDDQPLRFGIRKDMPELHSIINKGLASISAEESTAIRNKYMNVRYEYGISKTDIAKGVAIIGTAFGLVIGAILFWNILLGRTVAKRTADLNRVNQRLTSEIARRTSTENALRASHDYLDNLTRSIADIVVSVKMPERTIEWVNDAIRTLGYEPREIIGRTTEFLYARHDDFIAMGQQIEASIRTNKADIVTVMMFRKKNGEIFPAEITMSSFEDQGRIVNVTAIVRDISERRKQERRIGIYQQRLKALASQLTMSEERERRRVATELHDHVGQSLAIARIQLASAQKSSSDEASAHLLEGISRTLLEASQQTRHLIFDLSTPAIKELGLQAAITDWLNEKMPPHGIAAELVDHTEWTEAHPITDDEAALLFRHTRELLNNVIKHAKADTVTVEVETTANEILITVQDNGVGFDATAFSDRGGRSGHFGLFSIEEGMTDMGGRLEIESSLGKGCRAVLRLPIADKGSRAA
jgi:two-component system sensor histidine kinase EvgS